MSAPVKPRAYVYVLVETGAEATGPVKIGVTQHPDIRISAHQVSNYREVAFAHLEKMVGDIDATVVEDRVHRALKEHRIRGEWFNISVAAAIKGIEGAHNFERINYFNPIPPPAAARKEVVITADELMQRHPLALATSFIS